MQPVFVGTRVVVLRRPPVVDGDDNSPEDFDKAAAEGVVDGAVGGGMSEAAAMEEEENGDDVGGAKGMVKVERAPAGRVERRWLVDSAEKTGGSVDVVKGEDTVDGEDVGRNFTVEKLSEVTVEGAVGAAKDIVSELEIRNEDPCVERHYPLHCTSNYIIRY